jgi:ribose transport system ATP-binding protein
MQNLVIDAKKISKKFPGTLALDKVDFTLKKGELHAIVGENGAGKSTFIKILSGVHNKDSGKIFLNNLEIDFRNTREAMDAGIGVIYQELENLPKLSVAENIFLGKLPKRNKLPGFVNSSDLYSKTKEILMNLGIDINPKQRVSSLSIAEQQLIEIAKAISKNLKILIMDEPTSFLSTNEAEQLFKIIDKLKEQEISIIYISHRLGEVLDLSDRVTVFRDGKNIGTVEKGDFDERKVIKMMIGHELKKTKKQAVTNENIILSVKKLNIYRRLYDFNMDLREGEILGIAGLIGCGKDELIKALFGLWPKQSGEIVYFGKKFNKLEPNEIIKNNIVYLPEERKEQGLFLELNLKENLTPIWLYKAYSKFIINAKEERKIIIKSIDRFSIKTVGPEQKIINLSGGNQQKVIFARLLTINPKILLLHDPTRGIDVGSKEEIYSIILELAKRGSSIIFISSEIQEVCNLSNRIISLFKGKIVREFEGKNINMENVLTSIMSS